MGQRSTFNLLVSIFNLSKFWMLTVATRNTRLYKSNFTFLFPSQPGVYRTPDFPIVVTIVALIRASCVFNAKIYFIATLFRLYWFFRTNLGRENFSGKPRLSRDRANVLAPMRPRDSLFVTLTPSKKEQPIRTSASQHLHSSTPRLLTTDDEPRMETNSQV